MNKNTQDESTANDLYPKCQKCGREYKKLNKPLFDFLLWNWSGQVKGFVPDCDCVIIETSHQDTR